MSIAAAGIFTFSFSSCSDEIDSPNTGVNDQQAPEGARTELLEAYGLTFENFINEDDVIIIDADTTQLSVSKAYADKMGITSFVNHASTVRIQTWLPTRQCYRCTPYIAT